MTPAIPNIPQTQAIEQLLDLRLSQSHLGPQEFTETWVLQGGLRDRI